MGCWEGEVSGNNRHKNEAVAAQGIFILQRKGGENIQCEWNEKLSRPWKWTRQNSWIQFLKTPDNLIHFVYKINMQNVMPRPLQDIFQRK